MHRRSGPYSWAEKESLKKWKRRQVLAGLFGSAVGAASGAALGAVFNNEKKRSDNAPQSNAERLRAPENDAPRDTINAKKGAIVGGGLGMTLSAGYVRSAARPACADMVEGRLYPNWYESPEERTDRRLKDLKQGTEKIATFVRKKIKPDEPEL